MRSAAQAEALERGIFVCFCNEAKQSGVKSVHPQGDDDAKLVVLGASNELQMHPLFEKMTKAMFAKQLGKHVSLETMLVGFVDRLFTRLYSDFESNKVALLGELAGKGRLLLSGSTVLNLPEYAVHELTCFPTGSHSNI